jgi:flavin-dependent dehydrogenase
VSDFDAIILGAGAAGLFCAAVAGQRGRRVLLLDHNDEPGRKILISGAGAAISPISIPRRTGSSVPIRISPNQH